MIAADAMKGLLAITTDRRVTVLADHVTPNRVFREFVAQNGAGEFSTLPI
jgi:hypothetical protein